MTSRNLTFFQRLYVNPEQTNKQKVWHDEFSVTFNDVYCSGPTVVTVNIQIVTDYEKENRDTSLTVILDLLCSSCILL